MELFKQPDFYFYAGLLLGFLLSAAAFLALFFGPVDDSYYRQVSQELKDLRKGR